jgi:hypothetical protein
VFIVFLLLSDAAPADRTTWVSKHWNVEAEEIDLAEFRAIAQLMAGKCGSPIIDYGSMVPVTS